MTDVDTGFVFAAYSGRYDTSNGAIQFRVAVPSGVGTNEPYDAVLQVVAPTAVGWAGVAWGGSMTYNPLTVVWPSGQTVTLSSRWATCVVAPVLVAFFGSGNKLMYCHMFISLTLKPERAMPQKKGTCGTSTIHRAGLRGAQDRDEGQQHALADNGQVQRMHVVSGPRRSGTHLASADRVKQVGVCHGQDRPEPAGVKHERDSVSRGPPVLERRLWQRAK